MSTHKKINLIGFDSGWGCGDFGCEDAFAHLPLDQIIAHFSKSNIAVKNTGALGLKFLGNRNSFKNKQETLDHTITSLNRLCEKVTQACKNNEIPIVIGGDHSSAIGTWSGITHALHIEGECGLIWIDAHLDCHTSETSWQGKFGGWWHGQPLAALTGQGLAAFTNLNGNKQKINPKHICILGGHSFEPAEIEFINKYGIKLITLQEIQVTGFEKALQTALRIATTGTKGFGLSIDIDAFHPHDAPGVGTCEADGLRAAETLIFLQSLAHHPLFRALEIVEFNPHNDANYKTAQLIEKILKSLFC